MWIIVIHFKTWCHVKTNSYDNIPTLRAAAFFINIYVHFFAGGRRK
jgi:hypothetical protein